jgi:hypothetical protein
MVKHTSKKKQQVVKFNTKLSLTQIRNHLKKVDAGLTATKISPGLRKKPGVGVI